jgi:hypothetical protein
MPRTLHRLGLSAACALLLTSVCTAQPPRADNPVPPSPAWQTVYLDGPAAVERLKTENPTHYAQVKAIVAAADVLCANGPAVVRYAGGHKARCEAMLLKTSNPPKRQISFDLDSTHYIALVVLTGDHPELTPALLHPGRIQRAQ